MLIILNLNTFFYIYKYIYNIYVKENKHSNGSIIIKKEVNILLI